MKQKAKTNKIKEKKKKCKHLTIFNINNCYCVDCGKSINILFKELQQTIIELKESLEARRNLYENDVKELQQKIKELEKKK